MRQIGLIHKFKEVIEKLYNCQWKHLMQYFDMLTLNDLKEKIIDKQKENKILIFKFIKNLFYLYFLFQKLNPFL